MKLFNTYCIILNKYDTYYFSGVKKLKMAVLMRALGGLSGLGLVGCATMRRQMGVLASQDPTKAK